MRKRAIILGALGLAAAIASCGRKGSNLETYGLRNFELQMDPEKVGEMISGENLHLEVPARAIIDGAEYRIKLRPAGSSSLIQVKKSLELEFLDEKYDGANEIRLSATSADFSMVRTPLALEIFKTAGLPVSKYEYVTAYLNGKYLGLFLRVEKVQGAFFKKRKIPWLRIYKVENEASFEPEMESRLAEAFSGKPEPQNLELMGRLTRIASLPGEEEFAREAFVILNRAAVVNYLTASQLTNHYDGFNKNLFYVERTDSGLLELVPWDFDLDWRKDLSFDWDSAHRNKLWTRLHGLPDVKAEVQARVKELAEGKASLEKLSPKIDEWSAMIAGAYAADPFLGGAGRDQREAAEALRRAISERLDQVQ